MDLKKIKAGVKLIPEVTEKVDYHDNSQVNGKSKRGSCGYGSRTYVSFHAGSA